MKGGDEMINQYVIEGKCVLQPFTDLDSHKRLYVQANLESTHGLVYVRSYNSKLINDIVNDVHLGDSLMITGFVGSISEAGNLIMILNISEFTII